LAAIYGTRNLPQVKNHWPIHSHSEGTVAILRQSASSDV